MKQTLTILLTLLVAAPLLAQEKQQKAKIDFGKQVFPILEKHCVECHRETYVDENGRRRRPKGKVMLDTLANIKKSKGGKLFVAKKPDDSLVVETITLPADDEDRMPPPKKGPPLSKADVELIRKWIEEGADFGKWTGEAAPKKGDDKGGDAPKADGKSGDEKKGDDKKASGKTPKSSKPKTSTGPSPLVTLSKGLRPVKEATLQAFAAGPFSVTSVGDDNPLLSVCCAGRTDEVDDAAVKQLLAVKDHITELDLSRSQVTGACCDVLAQLPRLTRLDLRDTDVDGEGAAKLAACEELRSLNLFRTKVSDYAMHALARLKHLEQLYVWQTDVTAKAVVRLREQNQKLRVVFNADLPEPSDDVAANDRRDR